MTLPPFRNAALLLDLDGTLVDIAPTPDAVVVPPGLIATLRMIRGLLDGAVAIVTGRTLDVVDALFGDAAGAVAGEHGGAIRPNPDAAGGWNLKRMRPGAQLRLRPLFGGET